MKKIFCVLLALVMTMALCSCGNEAEEVTDVPSGVEATEAEAVNTEKTFSFGETDGDIYKNEFIGLGYKKASDWVYFTEEQIMETNNIAMDMVGEDVEAIIEAADVIYDMYVASPTQLESININLEQLDEELIRELDIKKNYELLVPTLESAFEDMGATAFEYEHIVVDIDGEKFDGLKTKCNISGVDMYQLAFQKKCGSYLVNVTVTSCVDDITAELVDNLFLV